LPVAPDTDIFIGQSLYGIWLEKGTTLCEPIIDKAMWEMPQVVAFVDHMSHLGNAQHNREMRQVVADN
jgi:hypothetical protein